MQQNRHDAKALARQALLRHLVMHGLPHSKPSGLAQARALDGATGLV